MVSRKGHQRETTELVITEYCSDLAHRPVPLRPIPPHQVIVHAPILYPLRINPRGVPAGRLRFISSAHAHITLSKLSRAYAAFTWANSILHIGVSLSSRIWPARFKGGSHIRVTPKASNFWVKCSLRPYQGGVMRYTLQSSPRFPRGSAQMNTHS